VNRSAAVAVAGVLALAGGAAGCADSDLGGASSVAAAAVTSGPAGTCTAPSRSAIAPAEVTSLGLLPDGAVVTGVEQRSQSRTVVGAVVARPFAEVLAAMRTTYAAHGLTLKDGEVEKRDAESTFTGAGHQGRWALRQVDGCPGATTVSVVVAPVG
jgi:hypothetical protein